MEVQRPLFVTDYDATKLARATDPQTSHAAATDLVHSGALASQCQQVLDALKKATEPITAGEIEKLIGMPKHIVMKRLPDLARKGLAERCGQRECRTYHTAMTTWRAT